MNAVQGVTFEKDTMGVNRYIRIDMLQHAETLRPLMQTLGINPILDGWEEGLTSEEFLKEANKLLDSKIGGTLDASDPKYQEILSCNMLSIEEFKKFTGDFVRKIENENGSISVR